MVGTRRKGSHRIDDLKQRAMTFLKRSRGLMKKASDLCSLTGAVITLIMFFEGEFCFFGSPSAEGVISKLLLPTSPKERVDWAEKECDSCETKEECTSLIMKYRTVVDCLLKKLKDFENNQSVNAGAGHESGVGAGREPSLLAVTPSPRNLSTTHTGSSSSLSLSEKTKKRPSSPIISPPPQKIVRPRRKGSDKIDDPKQRAATFQKRSHGLIKKASDLCSLTDAFVTLTVLGEGKFCSFGSPSTEGVISNSLLPTSSKEWVDWAEKERDSCATKEDCTSLLMKYLDVVVRLHKKLKDSENNPSVNAGAGHKPGVRAGRDPSFVAFNDDDVDGDNFSTLPADWATTSGESLGMDCNSACPNEEAFGSLLNRGIDRFRSQLDCLSKDFNSLGDQTELEGELSCSDLEGYENEADDGIYDGLESLGGPFVI